MRYILSLIPVFLFSSCATLILKKDHNVRVETNIPDAKAEILDSVYNLPAVVKLKRSGHDLSIKLISDSIQKDYLVKASPNAAFLYGNLVWNYVAPVAYLVDFTSQKRFYYGGRIFLNFSDTSGIIRPAISKRYRNYFHKRFPTEKGQLNVVLSLPMVNSFYFRPNGEPLKANTGFWGISAGLEYYYREKKYLSLTGSAVMDYLVPVPVGVSYSGEAEKLYSAYIGLTDNYKVRRFTFGYGLNFSRNTWKWVYHDRFGPPPPTRDPVTKATNSFGITMDAYHQLARGLFVGVIYRPTLLTVYPEVDFKYEHLVSLDFKLKIRRKK